MDDVATPSVVEVVPDTAPIAQDFSDTDNKLEALLVDLMRYRPQADVDLVRRGYLFARDTMSAADVYKDRKGVCRDFTHLAITLCRCMNIPARYTTGYLGDIGVPYAGQMDFSAWFEVFLGDRWYTSDARHNVRRIGRIIQAIGRDAGDVPITMCFGPSTLLRFDVVTDEVVDPAALAAAA